MEDLFDNTGFAIILIIQLLLLIVFLRMAWNVGRIRKHLLKEDSELLLEEANLLEFKGKKEKAIDIYMDYIYFTKNKPSEINERKNRLKDAVANIERLGGTVPESIKRMI